MLTVGSGKDYIEMRLSSIEMIAQSPMLDTCTKIIV